MTIRRRFAALTGAAVFAVSLAAGAAVALPGPAEATTCTGTLAVPCAAVGTVTMTNGVLTMLTPSALTWSATLTGQSANNVVDNAVTDTGYEVSDLTGSSAGWNITATATPLTELTPRRSR